MLKKISGLILVLMMVVVMSGVVFALSAATPQDYINIQGRVTENGVVAQNKSVIFWIGGAQAAVRETVTTDDKGIFNAVLGPFDPKTFDATQVEIRVDNSPIGTQDLHSVPYAFRAASAEVAARAVVAEGLEGGVPEASPWTQTDGKKLYYKDGNVGIGTTAPSLGKLDVRADSGTGVYGQSDTGKGVYGISSNNIGVYGKTVGDGKAGVKGENWAVIFMQGGSIYYGYGVEGIGKVGVRGWGETAGGSFESTSGYGVYASAPKNYFSGNVGIGTTDPSYQLEVSRTNAAGILSLNRADTSISSENWLGSIYFTGNDGGSGVVGAKISAKAKGSWSGGSNQPAELQFYTAPDGGTIQQRMVINRDGNVGIGTTQPDAKLDVKTNSSTKAALRGKNTGGGPALEIQEGWIKLPVVSKSAPPGEAVTINKIVGKVTNLAHSNVWVTVNNSYVTPNSIILATRQDGYFGGTGVKDIQAGQFKLYLVDRGVTAFLVINQ